ncbi:MAG: triple tyrosine motif-containing protein, partial [Panacibacter sp.]
MQYTFKFFLRNSFLLTLYQLIGWLAFYGTSYAQQRVFTNEQHFSVDDGLPQSFISGITQDKYGFLWVSTLDGLARYDGRKFRIFRYKTGDSLGLRANTITYSVPRANNIMSIFYEGITADDFDMETFKVTPNTSRNYLQNLPHALWQIGNGYKASGNWFFLMENCKGIGWFNSHTGKISYANRVNGLLKQDTVLAITEAPDGRIYLVSEDGVQISDPLKKKFDFVPFNTGVKALPLPKEPELFYATINIELLPDNRVALLTNDRLVVLDIEQKTSIPYTVPKNPKQIIRNIPWLLKIDENGQVYFTIENSIFRLTKKGELKLLWENLQHPELNISDFFIDRTDVLWVGINAKGLIKINLQSLPFQSYNYKTSFMTDIMEMAGADPLKFPAYWVKQYFSYFFRQAYSYNGDLFVCNNYNNNNGVFMLNNKGFRVLPPSQGASTYGAIFVMPDNEVWVYDDLHYCWYRWKTPEALPEKLQLDAKNMEGMQIADAKLIGGYIWMSTYSHGLLQFEGSKMIHRFSGPEPMRNMPKDLTEICPDPVDKNKFWIGSRGGGLLLWDVNKGLQKTYTTNDGLPNNTIYCILPDKDGKIWCSTNKGIFRFDVSSGQVTAFEKADGLAGNEFNRAHKFTFSDGRLAFGGMDGFTVFNPAEFDRKKVNEKVPVEITSLQINNKSQEMGIAGSIVNKPLSTLSAIELPYNKNYLRIEFAALVFNKPQKTKYRYKLTGVDKVWIENGTNNQAAYAALRPGTYTFSVNATDNNGLWSASIKEISIIINPPFWFTWWAYIIYGLMALGLVRWYFLYREKRIKAEQNRAFEKREALRLKETDEMKDRFFSNITHEFRTPLTLIMSPLDKLSKDSSLSTASAASVKTAQKNSQQLLRLINEFLDFSKMNNGQMKL